VTSGAPRTQRERRRAHQRAHEVAAARHAAALRRRRWTLAVVGFVVLLALLAGLAATFDGSDRASVGETNRAGPASSSTTLPATGIKVPPAPAGRALTGPTPCPEPDGSSPRTTTFAEPPPICIDTSRFYEAVLVTSVGELTLQLNPQQAPGAVNNFVVLARYHYFDGQPMTNALPRQAVLFAGAFDNPPGVESPGYTIPDEYPEQGQIFTPGAIAMIPRDGQPDSLGGAFLLATFEASAGLPQNLTQFGIMLDGARTLAAMDKAASTSGDPTQLITIEDVRITESIPIDG